MSPSPATHSFRPRLRAHLLLVVAVASSSLVALALIGPSSQAAAQGTCNFLVPFGPDPSPNWKNTMASSPDGVPFYVHEFIVDQPALLAEVLAGVDTWEQENPTLNFTYMGSTTTFPSIGGLYDNQNVIGPDTNTLPSNVLGRGIVGGTSAELRFDIELNFYASFPLGIATPGSRIADLQSVTVHEFGHVLGLGHTLGPDDNEVMAQSLAIGTQILDLGPNDTACLAEIYDAPPAPVPTPQPTPSPQPAPTPLPAPIVVVSGASQAVEVAHTTTCLAGNGRVDTNIVNDGQASAAYRVEFAGLSPRQATVSEGDWWRMPITGRQDGSYRVTVRRAGVVVSDRLVVVDCDDASPSTSDEEIQVVNACRSGNGYVLFQFANNTTRQRSYIIEFAGVPNRSTSAGSKTAAVRAVTGRPDGNHQVLVRDGAVPLASFVVTVDCD